MFACEALISNIFRMSQGKNLLQMGNIAGILKDFFAAYQQKVTQATAPGSLDVMGGATDVAGSLLLQKPLEPVSTAYVAPRDDQTITLKIIHQGTPTHDLACKYPELIGEFPTIRYDYTRQQIKQLHPDDVIVALLGCLVILYTDRKIKFEGLAIVLVSDLPGGAGAGAIASLEIALLKAVSSSLNLTIEANELSLLAHRAENWVGGFATGPGRQLTSYQNNPQQLIPLRCQPAATYHPIDLPDSLSFVGIGTGASVTLRNAAAERVRVAMFMGYSIIALAKGASVRDLEIARETGDWSLLPYEGYVGNISPSAFEDAFVPLLPHKLTGQDFFDKYQTSIDIISFIDRDQEYEVLKCTRLPVYENFRVQLFAQIIKNYSTEFQNYANRLNLMGELMYQSHQNYSDCGLGHPLADKIVEQVKAVGPRKGLYGARLTAPGNGGMVCILSSGLSGPESIRQIQEHHQQQIENPVALFR